jgi:hypothetical protein
MHRIDERLGPVCGRDPSRHSAERLERDPLERPDALLQRLSKIELTRHRSCGDICDRALDVFSGLSCDFVDAFLIRKGGVDIENE